ncbi:MAG: [FeFe] hydrogenase H-cluster maturation GTPase HydF, partial [Rikenellaceae bacterium]|nr:[FeFe] hydrogenase H-cluster maturation GTPase HydF [Rikenellaceae bacterium]
VVLVCPIDSEAPAGRMILPQMQAVREVLDRNAVVLVVQPQQLTEAFAGNLAPSLVITDSQVYREVRAAVPAGIEVTTFSILLAAAKGDYDLYVRGLEAVDRLGDGDRILIAESCLHQVSCEDIGRVRIPAWLEEYSGKKLSFTVISGMSPLPEDIDRYRLMVQCGGCMATRRQLLNRIRKASRSGVPVTNYGMLIRKIRG